MNQTITITLGDQAENHVGMQKLGQLSNEGFDLFDLLKMYDYFSNKNISVELIDLNYPLDELDINIEENAYILIIRNVHDFFLHPKNTMDDFFNEQKNLQWDKHVFMYGRVVNKHARYNLCYNNYSQEPDYESGNGRIISFNNVPLLKKIKEKLSTIIGKKGDNLVAEGNYYYDNNKCGIGFHGDSERKKVIGIRIGASLPLVYQWFHNSKPVGRKIELNINGGDIYIMSEKATGNDWKKKTIYTLRHATGSDKYTSIK